MTGDIWYFAYGSNLSLDVKQRRTDTIRTARLARLKNYRFAFNKRGADHETYANVMPASGEVVWGVVYLCNPQAMAELDEYEGVATGDYRRESVAVETADGQQLTAVVYIAGDDFLIDRGRPTAAYLQRILTGAKEHGLPAEYIRRIEALAR
jgi:gamma-glutamylcyclotransferase